MVGHLLAGILISSPTHHSQNQVKVAPAFADRAWKHLQLPWHWGLTIESELHAGPIGRIFDSGRGVFSSVSSWIASTTPLSPANWTSLACSLLISSSTSAKRSVAGHNCPLHEQDYMCVSQKVACLACALICDWRRHPIANQSWLQILALLDFSISFVVNDTAELEVDPAPAPSLCPEEAVWVWLGRYRLGRTAKSAESTRRACSPLHERFWGTAKQERASYFLKRHLLLLACGQSIRSLAQNRRIVSDFCHLGVWNFRRIVFHASLQVESSCYRIFLCWSPGHDIDKSQRKISRVAPFVHGSHALEAAAEYGAPFESKFDSIESIESIDSIEVRWRWSGCEEHCHVWRIWENSIASFVVQVSFY